MSTTVAGLTAATVATAATTQTTSTGSTTTTTTVLQQVYPEIAKVATTNGTHRIVVTLHPENLGEVRVTVVVRNGQVRVDMSTDPAVGHARDALIDGTSDLRRLPESSGTQQATVTVRDLATGTAGGDAGRGQNQPFTAQFGQDANNAGQSGNQSGNNAARQTDAQSTPSNPTTSPDVSDETRRPEPGRAAGSVDQLI